MAENSPVVSNTRQHEDYKIVYRERGHAIHVKEGAGTFGKREASGVPRLHIEVKDEKGAVVYQTWQNGPLEGWKRVTLYFDRYGLDARGETIGLSFWD